MAENPGVFEKYTWHFAMNSFAFLTRVYRLPSAVNDSGFGNLGDELMGARVEVN